MGVEAAPSTEITDAATTTNDEPIDNFAEGEPGAEPKKPDKEEVQYADPYEDDAAKEMDAEGGPPAGEKPPKEGKKKPDDEKLAGEAEKKLSPDEAMKSWDTVDERVADNLLQIARGYGITADRAYEYTPAQLYDAVSWRHQQVMAAQPQQQAAATTPQQAAAAAVASVEAYKIDVASMAEYVDPQIIKALQGMNDHYARVTNDLAQHVVVARQELADSLAQVQFQEASRLERWFESKLNVLGAEYTDLLGKGSVRGLSSTSKELRNRVRLFKTFNAMRSPGNGMPPVSEDVAFDQALAATFTAEQKQIVKKQLGNDLKARRQQSTSRPAGRGAGKSENREQAAAAFAENFFKEHGFNT